MKVFVTSWALSTGIMEAEAELCDKEDMISIKNASGNSIQYVHKPHWFVSRENAVKQAEAMRIGRIKSLKKTIEKLEKLTF